MITNNLLKARLGHYEKNIKQNKSIEGIDNMIMRLQTMGGYAQQERMIHDKFETFKRALHFSYQAAQISKNSDNIPIRALINSNKLTKELDDKIVSVGYEFNFQTGDVFEWLGTNTHWLIYLQDLTELAYFRGNIRKCNYELKWIDENDQIQSTWIALRGPVETKLNSLTVEDTVYDVPNHSLHILMPKNEATLKNFKRYTKFYITGADSYTSKICWRVEAIDTLSTPGILEINAVEYYSNGQEDDISEGLVGALILQPEVEDLSKGLIYGEGFIKPKCPYEYVYRGTESGNWYIDTSKYPIEYSIDNNKITVTWLKTFSGQFELSFGSVQRTIVVESVF